MPPKQPQTSLFQVYLRLRPPMSQNANQSDRFLNVEPPEASQGETDIVSPGSTHITLQPSNDTRKRAVERFGFTKVFEEGASQLDVFHDTGMEPIIRGVLKENRDGLVATLGVTGSGKIGHTQSHTILGSKTERGMTQMALDVIFRSLESTTKTDDGSITPVMLASLAAADASEAQLFSAKTFLDAVYGEPTGRASRAQTPMSPSRANTPLMVRSPFTLNSPQGSPTPRPRTPGSSLPRPMSKPGSPRKVDWSSGTSPNDASRSGFGQASIESPGWTIPGFSHPMPYTHSNPLEPKSAKSRLYVFKEPTPALHFPRRHIRERPCALPRLPDMGHLTVDIDSNADYVVLVSMYEVYNDRIFDLLSPSVGPSGPGTMSRGNNQKDRRRPLLFKPTEGSPDRKLVAGLCKIACSSYEEALAVLDVGLTERKVTGTGMNSVSSRSHGFFSLEVKRRTYSKRTGEHNWAGNTLTVVDLAGSERARTAKTAGATLAEAGKINESLMYLGQCLQMQSNIQDGLKTALVPYRQCKLTELLFSNSFPTSHQMSRGQYPQKAIMIVTADPLGDFNATSQILRYSALAREVTVPRAPSVCESISSVASSSHRSASVCTSPNFDSTQELERAAAEITRLTRDCHSLAVRLAEEEIARSDVEMRLRAAEERCLTIEQDVREECWAEMDEKSEEERRRWQTAWDEQIGRNDEHIDKKVELVSRGFQIFEDSGSNERVEELEQENDELRRKLAALEREMHNQSPTRKQKLKNTTPARSNLLTRGSDVENALQRVDQLKLADAMFTPPSPGASPIKRMRKMGTRKWDLAPEDQI
ncbi:Kinesin family protein [Penicillium digitatum PHI26]|uniref:Kinesin family protein n=1 Tax=Penicillium digitatum (strain PHI26 / CECT 20796) TaxID=1170229 RepID=K9FK64_PEND2|nr:Kinesin family protein [Penicillium digitatum PHI26]